MRLEGLVEVEAGQAFDVKARQPHGADEHHAQRVVPVFELLVQLPLFHLGAVRQDIQPPLFEGLDFVLILRDDHGHLRLAHPAEPAFQLLRLLLGGVLLLNLQRLNLGLPVLLHVVVHPHAGHLVETDEHRLAAGPEVGIVPGEVPGDGAQARLRRQEMDLLGKLGLQLVLLVHVEVGGLDGVEDAVGDFGVVQVLDLVASVFVVERDGRPVVHGAFEVVNGDIAAEGAGGDVVVGEKRRAGEADAGGRGQHAHHIFGKDAVLCPVRLVRHEDNTMVGNNRHGVRVVEFVDQREDEAGVAAQLRFQICAAGGDVLGRLCPLAEQTAVFKGVADLLIQLLAVGEDHEGGRARELPPYLLREEEHGIALAAALRVPEDAELAVIQLPGGVGPDRLVDAEILVVARQNLGGVPAGVVIEDEVFKQVEEVFLFADAAQHGLQRDAPGLLLVQTLPLMEKLVLAAEGADLGLHAVGEHKESVVIEELRDRVQIVRVVVGIGVLHVHRGVFELHEQQRQAVDKADDIRPAAVEVAVDLHLLHREEVVFRRVLKVDEGGAPCLAFPVRAADGDGDAVAQEEVFLLVDLQKRRGGEPLLQRSDSLADLGGRDPGVELLQRCAEIPFQQDLFIACPPQRAVFPQHGRILWRAQAIEVVKYLLLRVSTQRARHSRLGQKTLQRAGTIQAERHRLIRC